MKLGFSTGAIFRKISSISKEIIDICRKIGCNAIELNANKIEEVDLFEDFIKSGEGISDFKYISLHSPGINALYRKDKATYDLLKKLERAFRHFGCQYLVVHPSLVEDWSIFDECSFNLAVENMSKDNPAPMYLPEHLQSVFEKKEDYKMTFDVKHAFESGGEKLAADLYEMFKDRIVEIHLSGYDLEAIKHEHRPLIETKQTEILEFAKDKQHIPIIIESDCENIAQMKAEYEYVKKLLSA